MNGVTRISSEQDVMMITFTEADTASALADALTAFAQKGVVVDMPASYFESAMQTISEYRTGAGSAPLISSGYSKINLFGEEMVTSCGVAALALRTLRDAGIEVVLITTSDLDISLLVRGENEDSALNVLRQAFAA